MFGEDPRLIANWYVPTAQSDGRERTCGAHGHTRSVSFLPPCSLTPTKTLRTANADCSLTPAASTATVGESGWGLGRPTGHRSGRMECVAVSREGRHSLNELAQPLVHERCSSSVEGTWPRGLLIGMTEHNSALNTRCTISGVRTRRAGCSLICLYGGGATMFKAPRARTRVTTSTQ